MEKSEKDLAGFKEVIISSTEGAGHFGFQQTFTTAFERLDNICQESLPNILRFTKELYVNRGEGSQIDGFEDEWILDRGVLVTNHITTSYVKTTILYPVSIFGSSQPDIIKNFEKFYSSKELQIIADNNRRILDRFYKGLTK